MKISVDFMKKAVLFIIYSLLSVFTLNAQAVVSKPPVTAATPKDQTLLLKEPSYSFGKIPQGRPVIHVFAIQNTGKEPLLLENVQASCGCTTPEWSREPIAPGAEATIKVGYNAYSEGQFNKTVTIIYNNGQTKTLIITGEVYKLPASAAPENASVQFLKQTNQ
jgi:hypothetical protein